MTTSGTVTPTPKPQASDTPGPGLPAGHVMISEAEHNRMNAELRRLKKEAETRATADAEAQSKAEREAAEARGAYDTQLAKEQAARKAAEDRANEIVRSNALLTEVTRRGYTGEQATALMKLTDSDGVTLDGTGADAAVDAAIKKYPALFTQQQASTPSPGQRQAPSQLPPSSTQYAKGFETIDGFLTMEEYVRTPRAERLTDAFQERVRKSEPFWPSEVPASSFSTDS